MARLTTVRLYGVLGARFGRVHRLAVKTSVEAVKALCINLDGFESYLLNAKKNGMAFTVFRGKQNISLDDFRNLSGESDIRIAPVLEGAKKAGTFQVILGAVMIAAGLALGPIGLGVIGTSVATGIVVGGVTSVAGGLFQMLSPQPTGLQKRQDADNKPSYAFGGAVNTTAMGNPIPVLYGERTIGGAILSAGIIAQDI